MKRSLLLILLTLGTCLSHAYDPFISPSQRVGVSGSVYQQRGPNEKVFGTKLKNETYPGLGVSYEYLHPQAWYVGGFLDWLLYRAGDTSSRYPKTNFYQGEVHLGYTFYPSNNLFLATYIGAGKTKNRIKHKDVKIGNSKVSEGAFYILRDWWYPVVGVYLESRLNDCFSIGLRGQYMPMVKKANGSFFAELPDDEEFIVDVYSPDLKMEEKYNFSGELPIVFYIPYTSSAIKVAPFGVTFFNGRLLDDGKALSQKDVCVYDLGVRVEYLYIF